MRAGARRAVVSAVALVSLANIALADDAGVHAFLLNAFGEAGQAGPASATPTIRAESRRRAANDRAPTVRYRTAGYRPLTVHRQLPTTVAAAGPIGAKDAKISIYDDPTLREGDAVMTADGIRVFAGSRSWPYVKSDFVTIAEAHDLSRDTVRILAALNSAPRS